MTNCILIPQVKNRDHVKIPYPAPPPPLYAIFLSSIESMVGPLSFFYLKQLTVSIQTLI